MEKDVLRNNSSESVVDAAKAIKIFSSRAIEGEEIQRLTNATEIIFQYADDHRIAIASFPDARDVERVLKRKENLQGEASNWLMERYTKFQVSVKIEGDWLKTFKEMGGSVEEIKSIFKLHNAKNVGKKKQNVGKITKLKFSGDLEGIQKAINDIEHFRDSFHVDKICPPQGRLGESTDKEHLEHGRNKKDGKSSQKRMSLQSISSNISAEDSNIGLHHESGRSFDIDMDLWVYLMSKKSAEYSAIAQTAKASGYSAQVIDGKFAISGNALEVNESYRKFYDLYAELERNTKIIKVRFPRTMSIAEINFIRDLVASDYEVLYIQHESSEDNYSLVAPNTSSKSAFNRHQILVSSCLDVNNPSRTNSDIDLAKELPGVMLLTSVLKFVPLICLQPSPGTLSNTCIFGTTSGIMVKIFTDDLVNQSVDVIVNASNAALKHKGGLAKALADAAGPSLVKECNDIVNATGGLTVSDVVMTKAGQLQAKRVIHAVGPSHKTCKDNCRCLDQLQLTFANCFRLADESGATSIAIPAISAGNYGVPEKMVAEAAYLALLAYLMSTYDKKNSRIRSTLRDIRLVNLNPDITKSFLEVFIERIGESSSSSKEPRTTTQGSLNNTEGERKTNKKAESTAEDAVTIPIQPPRPNSSVREYSPAGSGKGAEKLVDRPELLAAENRSTGRAIEVVPVHRSPNLESGKPAKDGSSPVNMVTFVDTHFNEDSFEATKSTAEKGLHGQQYSKDVHKGIHSSQVQKGSDIIEGLCEDFGGLKLVGPSHQNEEGEGVVGMENGQIRNKGAVGVSDERGGGGGETGSPIKNHDIRVEQRGGGTGSPIDNHDIRDERRGGGTGSPIDNHDIRDERRGGAIGSPTNNHDINDERRGGSTGSPTEQPTPPITKAEKSQGHTGGEKCAICLEEISKIDFKRLECGHEFCRSCIEESFKLYQPKCPSCGKIFSALRGNQPKDGKMNVTRTKGSLEGHPNCDTIVIDYRFPDGIQTEDHPSPCQAYQGARRVAFLPDNDRGRRVLKLLRRAFDAGLIFTVGQSTTSGQENIVTWNDIHHKTRQFGQPYGYPDDGYLDRVTEELAAKGISDQVPVGEEKRID